MYPIPACVLHVHLPHLACHRWHSNQQAAGAVSRSNGQKQSAGAISRSNEQEQSGFPMCLLVRDSIYPTPASHHPTHLARHVLEAHELQRHAGHDVAVVREAPRLVDEQVEQLRGRDRVVGQGGGGVGAGSEAWREGRVKGLIQRRRMRCRRGGALLPLRPPPSRLPNPLQTSYYLSHHPASPDAPFPCPFPCVSVPSPLAPRTTPSHLPRLPFRSAPRTSSPRWPLKNTPAPDDYEAHQSHAGGCVHAR